MAHDYRLRQIMLQAKCPNMEFAEKEFTLTYMLQALSESNALAGIAFKGGTCIRKMLSGPSSRLSTDLDFTSLSIDQDPDALVLDFHRISEKPFHGFRFSMDLESGSGWYFSGDSVGFGIGYEHEQMGLSGEIRVQISLRAAPILEPITSNQLAQGYFKSVGFEPAALLRLRVEEMLAEKIRALCQRQKTRDLYDLHWFAAFPHVQDVVRGLVVQKLWESSDSFNFEYFKSRLSSEMDWDWDDLGQIVRGFDRRLGSRMLDKCSSAFAFLAYLSSEECTLATDRHRKRVAEATNAAANLRQLAAEGEAPHWACAHERPIGLIQ